MTMVVSYGGGVNSTAMLIGLLERKEPPELIIFADTGGERPETYDYIDTFSAWLAERGLDMVRVSNAGQHASLESECLTNTCLPSPAYGGLYRGCSVKWKRQPMDRYIRAWPPAIEAWKRGDKVRRLIGIDAGESHRGKIPNDKRFIYEFPLLEWDWARDECIEAIAKAGLNVPPKSACYFCPASKKREVIDLHIKHPSLFRRAVALEHNAAPALGPTMNGLGHRWSWESLIQKESAQTRLWPELEVPCLCFDGESDAPDGS